MSRFCDTPLRDNSALGWIGSRPFPAPASAGVPRGQGHSPPSSPAVSARESASLRRCEYRIASYRLPHLADKDALDRAGPAVFRDSLTFLPLARGDTCPAIRDVTGRRRASSYDPADEGSPRWAEQLLARVPGGGALQD